MKFRFDVDKATEALLYVAQRESDLYRILKILYYADKEHLSNYGRSICGESYVAMRLGGVPSGSYDILKQARGDVSFEWAEEAAAAFEVTETHQVTPRRPAQLDLLSESDIECLDTAIAGIAPLSFSQLRDRGHSEQEYQSAPLNAMIDTESLIKALPDGELLLDYLRSTVAT